MYMYCTWKLKLCAVRDPLGTCVAGVLEPTHIFSLVGIGYSRYAQQYISSRSAVKNVHNEPPTRRCDDRLVR